MQHLAQSYYTYAKSSCYRCGSSGPGVDFDAHIEGEGCLFLCDACIREAIFVIENNPLTDPRVEEA